LLACAGFACGSPSARAPGKDAGGSGGGSEAGSDTDGPPVNRDAGASSDRSDGADRAMLEMCPAERAHYDAAAYADLRCVSPDDTDRDGVEDCLDGCPFDATKLAPGACGCGIPDVDSDGDGVADCMDNCPFDPNNNRNGSCGCVGERVLQPA